MQGDIGNKVGSRLKEVWRFWEWKVESGKWKVGYKINKNIY